MPQKPKLYSVNIVVLFLFLLFSGFKAEANSTYAVKHKVTAARVDTLVDNLLKIKGPLNTGIETSLLSCYTDKISYQPGDTVKLFASFNVNNKVAAAMPVRDLLGNTVDTLKGYGFNQVPSANSPFANGYGYRLSMAYVISNSAKSGIYVIGQNSVAFSFIVRKAQDAAASRIVIVYPSNTDAAYDTMGGESLYTSPKSDSVSFLRPRIPSSAATQYYADPFFKWMAAQSYNASYISDMDLDNYSNINGATLLVIPGHSEYWTKTARQNFDAFVNAGNNALVLSGNTMWWQVRYSNDHTKMICYKSKTTDPISDVTLKTYEWVDPLLNYPTESSIGANHLLGGNGLIDTGTWANKGWKGYKIINDASPLLKNTNLHNGDIISVPTSEYDGTYLIAATETNNFVQPDPTKLGFKNLEVIGFDYGSFNPYAHVTVPTFIVFQKTVNSGYVVNTCSTDWCSPRGFGGSSASQIIQITKNGLDYYSVKPSANAALSSLALSSGTLSPAFASGTNNYTAKVSGTTTSLTITPVTSDNTATVTVNGALVAPGPASASIPLTIGANTITTTVTAQNSFTTNTYTVTVTRPSLSDATLSNLTLNNGTLSPVFSSGINNYTGSVAVTATSITLTPTANNPNATVTVNGTVVAPGSASASIPINFGLNTITTIITSQDKSTTNTYVISIFHTSPGDASLASLALSSGTLSPAFSSGTTSYTADVTNTTTSITLTPSTNNGSAMITINGTTVTRGSASASIPLNVGSNTITAIVVAQDGINTKTYLITVNRAPSNIALLNAISLNPSSTLTSVAGPGYANYATSVANSVSSIKVVPTAGDAMATVTVNGAAVISGTASPSIRLNVGPNTLTTVVTAEDGTTSLIYIITVTRAPSNDATLSSLALSSGTLNPAFSSGTNNYTTSVTNTTTSITLSPTVNDPNATVTVNGTVVSPGSASAGIPLNIGTNIIITTVIAQNNLTTNTYTIAVTRPLLNDATLSSLALSSGALSPVFSAGTNDYTTNVTNATKSITVTPIVDNPNATVTVNGTVVASGVGSASIPLNVGSNIISIVVTAQDGTASQTYSINATREIFSLPISNFKLTVTSATCRESNDGSVTISAGDTLNYTATITGNGLNNPLPFTNSLNINNLSAGTYSVCITVAGQSNYQQCYGIVITEPADLLVYATVNSTTNSIDLALSGGSQYNIQLNGVLYTTSNNAMSLPLAKGNNTLTVTTDRLCQGTVQKLINFSDIIAPYPVPFQDILNLNLGNTNFNSVKVQIRDAEDGILVYTNHYADQAGVLQLDLSKLANGVYVLHLSMDNSEKIFKIIKK